MEPAAGRSAEPRPPLLGNHGRSGAARAMAHDLPGIEPGLLDCVLRRKRATGAGSPRFSLRIGKRGTGGLPAMLLQRPKLAQAVVHGTAGPLRSSNHLSLRRG